MPNSIKSGFFSLYISLKSDHLGHERQCHFGKFYLDLNSYLFTGQILKDGIIKN